MQFLATWACCSFQPRHPPNHRQCQTCPQPVYQLPPPALPPRALPLLMRTRVCLLFSRKCGPVQGRGPRICPPRVPSRATNRAPGASHVIQSVKRIAVLLRLLQLHRRARAAPWPRHSHLTLIDFGEEQAQYSLFILCVYTHRHGQARVRGRESVCVCQGRTRGRCSTYVVNARRRVSCCRLRLRRKPARNAMLLYSPPSFLSLLYSPPSFLSLCPYRCLSSSPERDRNI
jgi:hypothetical protein